MFIEQYRLERNPFAPERVRSIYVSHSFQHVASTVDKLLRGHLQCLYLTGVRGVGKTTLVESRIAKAGPFSIGRIAPQTADPAVMLRGVIKELGLGEVDGTVPELRRILEVFLTHQASRGRRSVLIADGVESASPEVLREVEMLANLRVRGRPVVQLIVTTRNEELVASLMSRHDGSALAPAIHQRLLGFTLDETGAYLRSAVEGADCEWFSELFASELLVDIQAFTQGVVGDVDALCAESLEALSIGARNTSSLPRLSMALLKATAAKLHLKYDAGAWKAQHEEVLEPGAVTESRHDQLRIEAARLIVTSGGRRVAEVSLNRPRMVLGRDTSCDISLDSGYVSRYQNLFMETGDGWMLIDLNSTNGCFVNGRRVHEHRLRDGDLISLGQHQLRFSGSRAVATGAGPIFPSDNTQRLKRRPPQ